MTTTADWQCDNDWITGYIEVLASAPSQVLQVGRGFRFNLRKIQSRQAFDTLRSNGLVFNKICLVSNENSNTKTKIKFTYDSRKYR